MGYFGEFFYTGGKWVDETDDESSFDVSIHDSDIATIAYGPAEARREFFLGFQPRDYFENPDSHAPVDPDAEAEAFAAWAREALGAEVTAAQVRPLIAEVDVDEPPDTFVEDTVRRLLELVGVPVPEELPGG